MMVYELSNHSRRPSFSSVSDDSDGLDDSSRLKSMMGFGNLLPSLDASMDSQYSMTDVSGRTQTTTSTTLHTSSALSSTGSGAGSSAHLDLDDTEEELLAFRATHKRTSVKSKLKKAFGKISSSSKSKPSSSSSGDGKKTRGSTAAKSKQAKVSKSKGVKLEQDEANHCAEPVKQREKELSLEQLNYDEVSVDSTIYADPPTVCSVAAPEMVDESEVFLEAEKRRSMAPHRRKTTRPRRTDMASPFDQVLDESSGSSQKNHRPTTATTRPSLSNKGKVTGREDLKKARSSHRGVKSSGSGTSSSAEKKRLPPKSKSYNCDRPSKETRGVDSNKRREGRPDGLRRAASFVGPEGQRHASSRSSQVNAQAAIPNPRPSIRGSRKETVSDQRHSSVTTKRRIGDSTTKLLSRSKSSSKIVEENKPGHSKGSKRGTVPRSKSFADKADQVHSEDNSSSKSRSQSFDGSMPSLVDMTKPSRRRSTSRSKSDKKKSNPALNTSGPFVVCRHGEKLGECCYDQACIMTTSSAPLPLFSLDDHFGVEKPSDEISIDTASTGLDSADNRNYLSTFLVTSSSGGEKLNSDKLNAATKSDDDNDEKQRRRRSNSRSKTPSDSERSRSRSPSRSHSKSRSQSGARLGDEQKQRSPSRSRRESNDRGKTERGRRSVVKVDRERSESRSQRGRRSSNNKESSQSKSQRGRRSISRSKSPSHRPSATKANLERSDLERRPSNRSVGRSKSRSPSRRPSISEHHKGRRPTSRGKSRSPSRGPSTKDRRPSSRSKSPSRRILDSETNRGRSMSVARSQQLQQEERSNSKVRRPAGKEQTRELSASTARRESSSKNIKVYEALFKEGAATARREASSKNVKKYETLSKEDLVPSKKGDAIRRPRSLSRTRLGEGETTSSAAPGSLESQVAGNQHTRVSRSLSRTRSKSNVEHEGIGDYLQKRQPAKKGRIDDETNSHTTGTSSNGTNEIIYATPSWMWQNSSNATQNSFFMQDAFGDFNQSIKGHNQPLKAYNQSATSFGSNSYDASAEMATPRSEASNSTWGAPTATIGGPRNDTETLLQETSKSATSTNISPPLTTTSYSSMGRLPAGVTPGTKAKEYYGKIMKQEQEQLLRQSELLFQND